jgi:hypothetical protein
MGKSQYRRPGNRYPPMINAGVEEGMRECEL